MEEKEKTGTEQTTISEIEDLLHSLEHFEVITQVQENKKETYLRITEDEMEAWLFLSKPDNETAYTYEEIQEILVQYGVTEGYIRSNLKAMAKKRVYEREIKVAVGVLPLEGKDGYYEYFFDTQEVRKPHILEDGSADYSSMSLLPNVSKGDRIALYHGMERGVDGYTVKGQVLKAIIVKDLPPLQGRGFYMLEGTKECIASLDGKAEFKNGKLNIQAAHIINGDVTIVNGKVEFYGDIVINGNVVVGSVIRAGKSLTISGNVEEASIFAGGDIILKRGVQGANKGRIVSRGNIFADFIEQTDMEAEGNITANSILNSVVNAKGKVMVSGKKGVIVGGYVHGLLGVETMNAGNEAEVRTVIHAGYTTEILHLQSKMNDKAKELKKELLEIIGEIKEILKEKQARVLPVQLEEKLEKLVKQKNEQKENFEETIKEQERVTELMQLGMGAEIKVDGNIYRGVMVGVGTNKYRVPYNTCYMQYKSIDGMLVGNVMIKN